MKDLVSIIIPIYKSEKTLERCLDSILNQSYTNLQIILINDGSPDNSSYICNRYAEQDSRILYLNQENKGAASARNKGIRYAQGKYITFVDSDDYIDREYIKSLYSNMLRYNVDLVLEGYKRVYIYDNNIELHSLPNKLMDIKEFLKDIFIYLDDMLIQGPCFKIFKTEIIHKNNIKFKEDVNFGEDTFFIYEYLRYSQKIYNSKEINYNYIFEKDNTLSTRPTGDKINIFLKLYEELENIMKMNGVYNYNMESDLNHRISNILIYINYDLYHLNKIQRLKKIKNAINIPKIRDALKGSNNLNFQGRIIKKLALMKNYIAIDTYFDVKRLIKKILNKRKKIEM